MKKNRLEFILIVVSFIVLTFPNIDLPTLVSFNGFLKIAKTLVSLYSIAKFILSRMKIDNFSVKIIMSLLILLFMTIINSVSPGYFFKVYFFNFSIILLSVYTLKKYEIEFLKFITKYNIFLLFLNFISIILSMKFQTENYLKYDTFLLGLDNRFILYIIIPLISLRLLYLNKEVSNDFYFNKTILTLLLGISSLLMVWSVSAMFICIIMVLLFYVLKYFDRLNIDVKKVLTIIIIISFLIVFFGIQKYFQYLIVFLLKKNMDLSYRTIIWSKIITILKQKPIHYIIGYGFRDTSKIFIIIQNLNVGVIHAHNILMNTLFFGGAIWLYFYLKVFYHIAGSINSIQDLLSKKYIFCIFIGLLLLLLFDTFEYYPIYYFILYLINYYCSEADRKVK